MLKEALDAYNLLARVHQSIDNMLKDVPEQDWLRRPGTGFNTIASIVEHMALVERKFMSAVAGQVADIDSGAPFRAETWDVTKVKETWVQALAFSKNVLEDVQLQALDEPGMKVGIGELNKRQLIMHTIAHTAHHRGQLPLIKRMLANSNN